MTKMTTSVDRELAEPYLTAVLASAGLDVEYVRAEGNTLFLRDGDGKEVPVLDCVGGYGSLLLGHNHPEIIRHAASLLGQGIPVHAQFSRRPDASTVASVLSGILRRETGSAEPFMSTFANSGAEAVEAALKHAELDRVLRLSALREEIDARLDAARTAVRAGEAIVPDEVYRTVGAGSEGERRNAEDFDAVIATVRRENTRKLSAPPVFLTLEGSFHGKLMGSVQLTHNEAVRAPFRSLGPRATFVPFNDTGALRKIVEELRTPLTDIVVEGGAVRLVPRDFPRFGAFLVEPVQGEGGIHVLSPEFAREIRRVCDATGCPLVVDEIQCGMGRTGTFLASSALGLRGDYYLLAKSLGGGVAKISVMLVRESRYRQEFELMHSSTYAKDAFSSLVALRVLELLEAGDGQLYRRATERGERLAAALESVRAGFPDVVKEVRGLGLMLGVEFHDQAGAASDVLGTAARSGLFGYVLAGHMLRRHRVRVFPTASAVNTLRFEPSVFLTDEEIAQVERALRETCAVVRGQDDSRFDLPAPPT